MNRRQFLKNAAILALLPVSHSQKLQASIEKATPSFHRVRPGDSSWPSEAKWAQLNKEVHDHLIKVESPLKACNADPAATICADVFKELKNPFYIGDSPALTQTSGWVDAWTSSPSAYAVAAQETADVVAAVNFARENNLRLVVKGGGHSYQGTSNSADSLLIWTRAMNSITLQDAFVAQGCAGKQAPQPAVTVGSGCIWMHVYNAVTTQGGRYVQGGGCATVGVAGLIQSGGFGSFSKNYGLAAAGLLEAEVVTADGVVRIANACTNPDLFWGLKGGGGGNLCVVTKLTLRTHELPQFFGGVFGTIQAKSEAAYRTLIRQILTFYRDELLNPHWGEQIRFEPDNTISLQMIFQGLNQQQAQETWQPFLNWIESQKQDYSFKDPIKVLAIPAKHFWDPDYLRKNLSQFIIADDRPGAPAGNIFWVGNLGEAGQFLHGYRSAWLPVTLLEKDQEAFVDALYKGSRHWGISLHCNKGLAGSSRENLAAAKDTAMNPAVLDAFALAILGGEGPPAFPGIPGHEPDLSVARSQANEMNRAMDELLKVVPSPGSYVSESDFFERSWQESFWGSNYPKLAAVKEKYDPGGMFFTHHGVGSENWSPDGFTKIK